jgi:hypothetical protein
LAYADLGYQLVAVLVLLRYLVNQGIPEQNAHPETEIQKPDEVVSFIKKPVSVTLGISTQTSKKHSDRYVR